MRLPRTDALLAFAGATLWAYPFMLQVSTALQSFAPSRERQRDLREVPRRIRDVVNGMLVQGDTFTDGYNEPLTELLLGGWSWQAQDFRLWRFHWVPTDPGFRHQTIPRRSLGLCRFIGDRDDSHEEFNVVPFANQRLHQLLLERGKLDGPLDMEPFEVLVEMIRGGMFPTVGGPPQLAKVYPHMNTQFFAVPWPNRDGALTYGGRRLLPYEQFGVPELDPDRPELHSRAGREAEAHEDEVLLGLVETAGHTTLGELAESAAASGLIVTHERLTQWAQVAAGRGEVDRAGADSVSWPDRHREPEVDDGHA